MAGRRLPLLVALRRRAYISRSDHANQPGSRRQAGNLARSGGLAARFDRLARICLRPVLNMPRHPIRLALWSRAALRTAARVSFTQAGARVVQPAPRRHVYTRLDRPLTASLGSMIWPAAIATVSQSPGRSRSSTKARAALDAYTAAPSPPECVAAARHPQRRHHVTRPQQPQCSRITGDMIPPASKPGHHSSATRQIVGIKSAYAIEATLVDQPICQRAGTVHLVGQLANRRHRTSTPKARWCSDHSLLVRQRYSPTVPLGQHQPPSGPRARTVRYTNEAPPAVIGQIRQFAGFRDRIVATVSTSTTELQTYSRNFISWRHYHGGAALAQVVFRA